MTFNPKAYVKKSDEVVENYKARKVWREENSHLALPFFVEGLREQIPPIYPEEMALIGAASGDGKSLILSIWREQAQKRLQETQRRAVTATISHEETTERLMAENVERNGEMCASSNQSIWIGMSWGMDANDIADMHMTNLITSLEFARQSFAEPMPISEIFYDYIQATPADPNRKKDMTESLRRLQISDDTRRLFNASKTFRCPVIAGAQTSLKRVQQPYNSQMLIPGRGDYEESAGLYQVPDFVFSFWIPRNTYSVGKLIEIDNWKFKVEINQVFMWALKGRGHNPETFKGISKVFPLRIIDNQYIYDPEYHRSLLAGVS